MYRASAAGKFLGMALIAALGFLSIPALVRAQTNNDKANKQAKPAASAPKQAAPRNAPPPKVNKPAPAPAAHANRTPPAAHSNDRPQAKPNNQAQTAERSNGKPPAKPKNEAQATARSNGKPPAKPNNEAQTAARSSGKPSAKPKKNEAQTTARSSGNPPAKPKDDGHPVARSGGKPPKVEREARPESRSGARPPVTSAGAGGRPGSTGRGSITGGARTLPPPRPGDTRVETRDGGYVHVDPGGRVSGFHDPGRGMTVVRGPHDVRTVETRRPDGSRVVAVGRSRGFVERPMEHRGYVSRTYLAGGRSYTHVYRERDFDGMVYHQYVPEVYYDPGFYVWAASPWRRPVFYSWEWNAEPWYGADGGYFTPAPAYPTPALWLTDFLLGANLRLAFEDRQQNGEAPPQVGAQAVALSPEIKQLIAEQVRQQLDAERAAGMDPRPQFQAAAATESAPPALDPTQRVFVESASLDVTTEAGASCALTPGDILLRAEDIMRADHTVGATVLGSKPGDCAINSKTAIDVATLQEMHNQFREQIDSGMSELAANHGQHGLPRAPKAKGRPSPDGQASPDTDADVELQAQLREADQAEVEARQSAATNPSNP